MTWLFIVIYMNLFHKQVIIKIQSANQFYRNSFIITSDSKLISETLNIFQVLIRLLVINQTYRQLHLLGQQISSSTISTFMMIVILYKFWDKSIFFVSRNNKYYCLFHKSANAILGSILKLLIYPDQKGRGIVLEWREWRNR